MKGTRQWIPVGGLLITVLAAGYMVAQLYGQTSAPTRDFNNAATAQVRDAQGQPVLQGQFMPPVEEDGGFERRARLAPTGVDDDAAGEAKVKFAKKTPTRVDDEDSHEDSDSDSDSHRGKADNDKNDNDDSDKKG